MTGCRVRAVVGAIVALLGVTAPAQAAPGPHVVGGTAALQDTPYVVSVAVTYPFGQVAACGGTLVAARYVITAGHCVAPDVTLGGSPNRVDVVIGAGDLRTDAAAERQPAAAIIRNPAYSTTGIGGTGAPRNDVAVLRLSAPSAKAQARLPRESDAALWAPGTTAIALGYGLTNPADDASASPQLRQVDLPIAGDDACQAVYGGAFDPSDLCAGGQPGKDTCQGDSGGPLVVGDAAGVATLVGVTSYGDECGRTYGVYTEAGGTVNAFLRSVVPQVEVDAPETATAGTPLTLRATGTDPDAGGTYPSLAWDLDADGVFDDAAGATAGIDPVVGPNVVAVQGSDAAGNRETRTVVVTGRRLAARVGVRASRLRVRGGRFTVAVSPNQAGRVTVTAKRGARLLGRSGTLRTGEAATRRLAVSLTRAGRAQLRRTGRLRVVVRATLRPSAGGASRTTRRVLLIRQR